MIFQTIIHSFESARKTGVRKRLTQKHGVRRCNIIFKLEKMLQIHVNVCDTIQVLAGFPQCNGGKLEECEDFKCIFVVYCVLESK